MERANTSLNTLVYDPAQRAKLTDAKLVEIATAIAVGMAHLSRENIVHRYEDYID